MWGTLVLPGPPRHLIIVNTREFGREFPDPQLHHVMEFPFFYFGKAHPALKTLRLALKRPKAPLREKTK